MSYKFNHALRLDAGAPTPRKPREQGAEKRCCTVHSAFLWRIKHDATKQEKEAIPERGCYLSFPLNKHLSSLKSYSTDLPHLFFPSSLLPGEHFIGCYKMVVFSFVFPFIYSIRTVPQGGKIQPPCPQESNNSLQSLQEL